MSQARRKPKPRAKIGTRREFSLHGVGILATGIIIGVLGTILYQGMQGPQGGVGSGIREMIEQSREEESAPQNQAVGETDKPQEQQTNFDFFTVLPEIEVVVPEAPEETPPPSSAQADQEASAADTKNQVTESGDATAQQAETPVVQTQSSSFMLQAGSYQRLADADKLKAQLALMGLSSIIQKVTIEGRGDFFRVRLGPYTTHDAMVKVDGRLAAQGIKALRLKVSRGG